jgi:hypothetical protein
MDLTIQREEVNEPVTESSEEVTDAARLEEENKNLRDGNSRLGREFKAYKEDNEDRYNTYWIRYLK